MIYDISILLGEQDATYPGDPAFTRTVFADIDPDGFHASSLLLSAHAGTHIESPAHVLRGGKLLEDYPPQHFILPALVVDAGQYTCIPPSVLEGLDIGPTDAVLFSSADSLSGLATGGKYDTGHAYLAPGTARALAAIGVALAGIDSPSLDTPDASAQGYGLPAHIILAQAGALALEGLNLAGVPPGRYTLTCLPLRMHGAEASPVRAILQSE